MNSGATQRCGRHGSGSNSSNKIQVNAATGDSHGGRTSRVASAKWVAQYRGHKRCADQRQHSQPSEVACSPISPTPHALALFHAPSDDSNDLDRWADVRKPKILAVDLPTILADPHHHGVACPIAGVGAVIAQPDVCTGSSDRTSKRPFVEMSVFKRRPLPGATGHGLPARHHPPGTRQTAAAQMPVVMNSMLGNGLRRVEGFVTRDHPDVESDPGPWSSCTSAGDSSERGSCFVERVARQVFVRVGYEISKMKLRQQLGKPAVVVPRLGVGSRPGATPCRPLCRSRRPRRGKPPAST
ncbi:hypothetical protein RLIN73S_06154 [Rhodanobacter lindaniclasticus]